VTTLGVLQIAVFLVILTVAARWFGSYMAWVYFSAGPRSTRVLGAGERGLLRLLRIDRDHEEQTWQGYSVSVIAVSLVFVLALYVQLRIQNHLPLNPDGLPSVNAGLAFNTATSFLTNTNWQYYAGESTMSYLTQMAGLAVQNFISAAVGMAVLAAVIRGFSHRDLHTLGNFWVDLYRSLVFILLPIAVVGAIVLVSQGVPDTFSGHAVVHTLQGGTQDIARGPVASQVAIKHLGTNGGGFFNANSATPFESPTSFTGYLELFLELLIPFGSIFMFGRAINAMRHAWTIFAAVAVIFVIGIAINVPSEQQGSAALQRAHVGTSATATQSGGNMEGKEVRYGLAETGVFTVGTTNTSTGAVVASHDSMTPLGGAVALVDIFMGEITPGGVGVGMNGMLLYIILAVFIAGLMVGRTPEYLGKKIDAKQIKLALVGTVFVPVIVLVMTAIAVATHAGLISMYNTSAHGFSEALYAYTSQGNNNGSAFAGYTGGLGYNLADYMGGVGMMLGRFVLIITTLCVAGSLAGKRVHPAGAGTLRNDTPMFGVMIVGVIILISALTILPALALGPLVEQLSNGRLF
jgi:potassium-transporting ATPase potassium-binding subunit